MKKIYILTLSCLIICIVSFTLFNLVNTNNEYEIGNTEFLKHEMEKKQELNLYFFRKDCKACQDMKNNLNKGIKATKNSVIAIDLSDNNNNIDYIYEDFNISKTPTLIKVIEGEIVNRKEGFLNERQVVSLLEK